MPNPHGAAFVPAAARPRRGGPPRWYWLPTPVLNVTAGAYTWAGLKLKRSPGRGQNGQQDGSTLLRNRVLAAHGWRVVVVNYREWYALQTEAQREEFLRRLLA